MIDDDALVASLISTNRPAWAATARSGKQRSRSISPPTFATDWHSESNRIYRLLSTMFEAAASFEYFDRVDDVRTEFAGLERQQEAHRRKGEDVPHS